MQINPMQMMWMLNGKSSPMQIMQSMLGGQAQNNPLFQRAQEMSKGKSPQEVEQVIRNLCQQRGIDYDSALQQFQSQFSGVK